jgi:toxin ParE1/3/4
MAYSVKRALETDRDLELIFDFLVQSYVDFGEPPRDANQRAATRVRGIESAMLALGSAPHQGTLRPDLLPGLRSVTRERAIFYFDVVDDQRLVRVLAVFFGGQDHSRAMLSRLLSKD